MEININSGIENKLSKIVGEQDSAANHGSGLLPVFATPAMVAFMEQTAHLSVGELLPEGLTTVGIEISVKHMKATPMGMQVTCESKLTKVEGKRLYFEIKAFDEVAQIGEATHTRFIVDSEKFMEKIK